MTYAEILFGLMLLAIGGDGLVRGAVALARRIGVSPLLIGLTLVGFGTSTPELVTSLQAALSGSPGIAVGNVVGSNTANILLILGIAALIRPIAAARAAMLRDGAVVLGAAIACLAVVLAGDLSRTVGILFVILLSAYLVVTYRIERLGRDPSAKLHADEGTAAEPGPTRPWLAVAFVAGGLALTVIGGRLLVSGAIDLARASGLSETVIGLTIVAVGTSLPELVTSLIAAARNQSDVALGNILGSNIFNVFGILGVTAIVRPIPIPAEIARTDIWIMLGATLAMLLFAATGRRIGRVEGGAFMAAYLGYLVYLTAPFQAVHA